MSVSSSSSSIFIVKETVTLHSSLASLIPYHDKFADSAQRKSAHMALNEEYGFFYYE